MPSRSGSKEDEVMDEVLIRPAQEEDLPRVAALAAELVRMHHATDPGRFLLVDNVEGGYAWWLARELSSADAVILVAERGAGTGAGRAIVGYAYGGLEERDWNMLLDAHGVVNDVFVAAEARRGGVGARLVQALVARLEAMGAPRVVLSTMVSNASAQELFRKSGFRPTMLEMTRNAP
jgi:ribosomal protein S18 acetylase RimI-like enzyme